MLLDGKKVLITGGTGALGKKLCEIFAREGADVAFNYLKHEARASEVVKSIEAHGRAALAFQASVLDAAAIAAMTGKITDAFKRIDILVNNAGTTQVLPFPLIEESDWDELMAVNVKGPFIVTKEVVRRMIVQRSGTILNVGSIAGTRMLEVPVHYATAKAAICGFTLSLARELARYGIRVNSVVPGMLDSGVAANVPAEKVREYLNYCAAGRTGRPEEVAELAAFLCSDRASYINAQNIVIDGGL
ncbi:MAG: SDR family oxidoreductase [Candidatus Aminicenantes bacterium]|nr:SDR family oxidoreductase [Candidatus Aminicenantes bacterium]